MSFLKVTNRWTRRSQAIPVERIAQRKLEQYLRNLPRGYNRNRAKRKLCYQIDRRFQQAIGNDQFYLSMYNGRQYKVEFK